MAFGYPLKLGQQPPVLQASLSPLPAKQGSVANADVALRVSVIDGADRMVYSDVRDRKGWAQPLALNEALRDAAQRSGAGDVPSGPQPRVIRELELRPSSPRNESAPTATPYQVGKANVRSPALSAPSRVETKMPKELVSAPTLDCRPFPLKVGWPPPAFAREYIASKPCKQLRIKDASSRRQ
ncbi:hypothetical protein [Variovorax sp. GrIS 2.14]|uniref:hypothetical protein n=1 Tax=Variovorax sp. GrIS 2.14 TaxID=3071709 RepID=UPI0038F5DFFB